MKVYFDSNIYVAEALGGESTGQLLEAVDRANWRVFTSRYQIEELGRVLRELRLRPRLATLACERVLDRSILVPERPSRHRVPDDPKDTPILRAALHCGADYLVTNDRHLLDLDPYEGLRVLSVAAFRELLRTHGLIE